MYYRLCIIDKCLGVFPSPTLDARDKATSIKQSYTLSVFFDDKQLYIFCLEQKDHPKMFIICLSFIDVSSNGFGIFSWKKPLNVYFL